MRTSRLILLGAAMAILAGVVASLLQQVVSGGNASGVATRELAVAARDLPSGHQIVADDLTVAAVPAGGTARTGFPSPAIAVGRTLTLPLSAGQALREEDLAPRGSGATIASQLPRGYRAITVALREPGPGVVLYPGAVVDVLATVDLPGRTGGQRETVTRTVLEGIRVVAVNEETLGGRGEATERRTAGRKPTVTLAVRPEQAAQLELAGARGTIGIALRGASDPANGGSAGAIATTHSLLGLVPEERVATAAPDRESPAATERPDRDATETTERPVPATIAGPIPAGTALRPKMWEITVIRGDRTTRMEFPDERR